MIKIKQNDTVIMLSGKDKGKKGKVTQVLPAYGKVVVDGVNKLKKHLKPQKSGEKGQIIEFNGPVQISNVALVCPKCSKRTRIGIEVTEKDKNRKCLKCKEVIS